MHNRSYLQVFALAWIHRALSPTLCLRVTKHVKTESDRPRAPSGALLHLTPTGTPNCQGREYIYICVCRFRVPMQFSYVFVSSLKPHVHDHVLILATLSLLCWNFGAIARMKSSAKPIGFCPPTRMMLLYVASCIICWRPPTVLGCCDKADRSQPGTNPARTTPVQCKHSWLTTNWLVIERWEGTSQLLTCYSRSSV